MTEDDDLALLFSCDECARDNCRACVARTQGEWCPHFCFWLLRVWIVKENP